MQQFLSQLDPALSLDWSGEDYQGLPSLRERVLDQYGYRPSDLPPSSVPVITDKARG
nr:hypothetical protein VDP59_015370 [Xanthomonas campestris pv. campestris]